MFSFSKTRKNRHDWLGTDWNRDARFSVTLRSAQSRRGVLRWLVSLFLVTVLGAPVPVGAAPTEAQMKAAFLFNFAKLIEWPAASFAGDSAPLVLGIIGRDAFPGELEATVAGQSINGRPLEIKRFNEVSAIEGCHLLFVGTQEKRRLAEIVGQAGKSAIVTVSDLDDFAPEGGVIGFFKAENKVRFEINVDAARRSGLKISSKLLNLARVVHDRKSKE